MSRIKQYYQLTKPGIIYGNLMTGAAGFLLAARGHIDIGLFIAAISGTALSIAAGCVFNNYIDRGIDKKMQRTSKRALVTGAISKAQALTFGTFLLLTGLLILAIFTNLLTLGIGIFAVFMYVVVYGYAKRRSPLGTLVGSIPGATPPLAGYTAVVNELDAAAWLLFLIMTIWQMPHFYAISIFRREDYKSAGLPVLAVKYGIPAAKVHIALWVIAYALAVPLLTLLGYTGYTYLVVMGALALYWLWLAINGFKTKDDQKWARQIFGISLIILMTFSATLALDAWVP